MRILYICNEYPPAVHGGIGVFVQTLAERLAALGHEISVIGYASHVCESAESVENGVRVARLAWPRGPVLRLGQLRIDSAAVTARRNLSRQAARFAREFRPDLVESHDWSGPLWTPPCRPLVVRLHGASSVLKSLRSEKAPRLMWLFERRNIRMADHVIAASRFIGASTTAAFKLPEKQFETLYHGIDTDWFRPGEGARRPNEVLFAGTVKRQKGIQELFRAIPGILAEAPDACITVAGRYPVELSDSCAPQSLLKTLPKPASTAEPWERRIRFLGQISRQDLRDLYRRAAVAVFPSHGEAFGLACAEAMSCGAAIVATDCGSAPELVAAGECGLLVRPRDSRALGSAVVRLLKDAALRHRLGAAARLRVVERFRLSDATARNFAFYEHVAGRLPKRQTVHKSSLPLAVCIPTYRRPRMLQTLLEDLNRQTVSIDRLIVVDGDPSSGSVLNVLDQQPCTAREALYVASNHANLPFQRYLGWRAAQGAALLLYLDDDLRLLSAAGIETLIRPLRALRGRVVGTTVEFEAPPGEAHGNDSDPDRRRNRIPWRRLLGRMGSSHGIPAGGVSPAGHRRPVPFRGKPYEIVGALRGGAMAYRMSAITEDCFSDALFAMGECGWGFGEDTLLSRNIGSRGMLLTAPRAGIVHPRGHEPVACRRDAFGRGYAIAYSRRLLNEHYRGAEPPRWCDRLALIKSYAANMALNWAKAAKHWDGNATAFAAGYAFGAVRGLLQAPSSRHLTPSIDWFADAEVALAQTHELSPIPA